jgi:hypothetical protein
MFLNKIVIIIRMLEGVELEILKQWKAMLEGKILRFKIRKT